MPGEGRSVVIKAESTAKGLRQIAEAIQETGGQEVNGELWFVVLTGLGDF